MLSLPLLSCLQQRGIANTPFDIDMKANASLIKTKEMIVDVRKKRTEHAPILMVSTSPTN